MKDLLLCFQRNPLASPEEASLHRVRPFLFFGSRVKTFRQLKGG